MSLALTAYLSQLEFVQFIFLSLDGLGYIAAFIAGTLFVSPFSATVGLLMLTQLTNTFPIIPLTLVAGIGATSADLFIYHHVKNGLIKDINYLTKEIGGSHLRHVLHSHYFSWTLPLIGSFMIASPLPDELGISLLGMAKTSVWRLAAISFFLKTVGIFAVLGVFQLF